MSNKILQFKFLDAGAKSSAVVYDPGLSTGNDNTLYLYHQLRDEIIEYKRDIVEAKLRELDEGEQAVLASLEKAFNKARSRFTPRGAAALAIPERAKPVSKPPVQARDDDADDEADEDSELGLVDSEEEDALLEDD